MGDWLKKAAEEAERYLRSLPAKALGPAVRKLLQAFQMEEEEAPAEQREHGPFLWGWIGTSDYAIHVAICAHCHMLTHTDSIHLTVAGSN